MKRILTTIGLAAFALQANATPPTQTLGRDEVVWPDITHPGGADLISHIHTAMAKVSDHLNGRYQAYSAIADSTLSTYKHNFGVAFDELTVLIYTGSGTNLTRVADPVASGWTIAANGTNPKTEIDVTTPGSGGPHTFAVVVVHGSMPEVIGDLDDVDVDTASPEDGQALVYDSANSKWVPGASGDSSFKCQAVSDPNLSLKGGYLILDDGRELATYDGLGSASTDFGVDLTVDLDAVLGTDPVDATTYYLYIDTDLLPAATTLSDNGRKLFGVTSSQLSLSTTKPDGQTLSRYVPLCFVKSATTGTVWSGAGSAFGTLAARRHDNVNAPVETFTTGRLTAAPSFPLAHGLGSRPKVVAVLTEGQSESDKDDIRHDLCSWDDTNISCDLSSLTIDATHEVEIVASAANQAISLEAASATKSGIVSTTTQTFAGNKTFGGTLAGNVITASSRFVAGGSSYTQPLSVKGLAVVEATSGSPNYTLFDNLVNSGKVWRVGDTGAAPTGSFSIYNDTDTLVPFVIKSDGKIGFGGETSPTRAMHLETSGDAALRLQTTNATASFFSAVMFDTPTTSEGDVMIRVLGNSDSLDFLTGGTKRFSILDAGQVRVENDLYVAGNPLQVDGAGGESELILGNNSNLRGATIRYDVSSGSTQISTNGADPASTTPAQVIDLSNITTFGGGIKLPTSGGTATTLDHYEEHNFSTTFTLGGSTSASQTVKVVRNGKLVTIVIPAVTFTTVSGDASIEADSSLPSRFRPSVSLFCGSARVLVNGTTQSAPGPVEVGAAGQILISRDFGNPAANFGTGASNGLQNTVACSYHVN